MAQVIFTKGLEEEINTIFKGEAITVFKLLKSLGENPHKGKSLGNVGGIVIKEVKYESYRFYFITDGHSLKVMKLEELTDLIIKFVRMSNKKYQQKTIDEIKAILRKFGKGGFSE